MNKNLVVLLVISVISFTFCYFTIKTCIPTSKPIVSTFNGRGKLEYITSTQYCKDGAYKKIMYHKTLDMANEYHTNYGNVITLYTNAIWGSMEFLDMIISRIVILLYTVICSLTYMMCAHYSKVKPRNRIRTW